MELLSNLNYQQLCLKNNGVMNLIFWAWITIFQLSRTRTRVSFSKEQQVTWEKLIAAE